MSGLSRVAVFAAGSIVACIVGGAAIAQAPAPGEGGGGVPVTQTLPLKLHEPTPVSAQMLIKPADGDWLMFRRTLNGWGYSPLSQITTGNVAGLKLAWSRPLPVGSYEGTPIVHDGVMYVIGPNDQI